MASKDKNQFEFNAQLVLRAYCEGFFPMGDSSSPGTIRWYSPDPRCIFDFDSFHCSKRLMRTYRNGGFTYKIDQAFEEVMWACADRESTWITDEIVRVYSQLNKHGYAHSVETYYDDLLVGGLYGVSIGGAFMGESMFHRIYLVERMKERGFVLLDTQYTNTHLASFNAKEITRDEYLARLNEALKLDCQFD